MLTYRNSAAFGVALIFVSISAVAETQLPPVGLAVSETAQVNVVNTALPPASGGAAPNCNGTIAFYGGSGGGVVLQVAAFQVQSGQIFSAALPYASTGATGGRTVIRIAITLTPFMIPTTIGPVVAPCTLASSFETFDSTSGVTHGVVSSAMTLSDTGDVQQEKSAVPRR